MGRVVKVAVAVVVVLLLSTLGVVEPGSASPERRAKPSLKVTVKGLPAGTAAAVTVKGPNRYKKKLTGTRTLKQLAAGTYKVVAKAVAGGTLAPVKTKQTITVSAGRAVATVKYVRRTTPPPPPPPPPPPSGGPQITTTSVPDGMVGATYFADLTRTQGGVPFDEGSWGWTAASAPPGLQLDKVGGAIWGNPTTAGSYSFSVTFTAYNRTASRALTLLVQPTPAAGNWKQVSAGIATRCGIKTDDTAWCWGLGGFGDLGNGANDDTYLPVPVSGGGTWTSIDVGGHVCGIKSDGTAWCWGWNFYGHHGNGTTTNSNVPVQVSGGGTWTAISAGYTRTCGIKTDGTAWCWGVGALGDGETTDSSVPVQVDDDDGWETITAGDTGSQAGYDHSCGTKDDGSAWCWHANYWGELGNGEWGQNADSPVPVEVGGEHSWTDVAAGARHTCGLRADAELLCWGLSGDGRLGTSGLASSALPDLVVEEGPWRQVSPGDLHTCGTRTDGTGWCWGSNGWKQLGPATAAGASSVPVQVPGSWASLDAGDFATCGVRADGKAFCWGKSWSGGLGDVSTAESATPVPILG